MVGSHAYIFDGQDYELVRVFDSMVFEDEAEDQITMGIRASGEMDSDQTRQALHLAASSQSEWHVRLCLAIAYIRILDLQMHMSFVTLALLVWCIQHVEFELFVCLLCTGSIHSGYCTVGGIQGSFHLVVIWPTFKRRGWDHMILHPCHDLVVRAGRTNRRRNDRCL